MAHRFDPEHTALFEEWKMKRRDWFRVRPHRQYQYVPLSQKDLVVVSLAGAVVAAEDCRPAAAGEMVASRLTENVAAIVKRQANDHGFVVMLVRDRPSYLHDPASQEKLLSGIWKTMEAAHAQGLAFFELGMMILGANALKVA
jgi:hypothetical protein